METNKNRCERVHPRDEANFFSHLFFCWQLPFFLKHSKQKELDFEKHVTSHDAAVLGDHIEKLWNEELLKKKPSLSRVLFKLFGNEYVFYGLLYLPLDLLVIILQPISLQKLVEYFNPQQVSVTKEEAYFYAALVIGTASMRVAIFYISLLTFSTLGLKMRVACSSLIYRRVLKMKKITLQKITLGQIVNILSNDVERFDRGVTYSHFLWITVFRITASVCFFSFYLDSTISAGLVVFILQFGFQMYAFRKIASYRTAVALKSDYRIQLINDLISGIQAIKMYAWENFFKELVEAARESEIKNITIGNFIRVSAQSIINYFHKLCVCLCILALILGNVPLTPSNVFAVVAFYELIKASCQLFNTSVIFCSEIGVTVKRLEEVLLLENRKPKDLFISTEETGDECVDLKDVTVKWDTHLSKNILDGVNLRGASGDLVAVVGPAGSGKTTLLQTILRETEIVKGCVQVSGSLSYASQETWIFPASLKENILFGEKMDAEKYSNVIKVCALEHDLVQFPHGDNTLIGERGVMLSGGQRARVNLARAIYRDADTYLLDDPLSAVDTFVAQHIFNECIKSHLRNKCVILVTHQIHLLKDVSKFYFVEDGKVTLRQYNEIVTLAPDFVNKQRKKQFKEKRIDVKNFNLQEEIQEDRGDNKINTYKTYCLAVGNYTYTFLLFLCFIVSQVFASFIDAFIAFWLNLKERPIDVSYKFFTDTNCLYICGVSTTLLILTTHLNAWIFTKYTKRASTHLHNSLFDKVIAASLSFFNQHPSGRILNRFSNDLGIIDEFIPLSSMEVMKTGLGVAAAFLVIVASTYWMIIPTVLICWFCYVYTRKFQPVVNHVKRLEGIRRSPVFTHLSASVIGLNTIRAFGAENRQKDMFSTYQNFHSAVSYTQKAFYYCFGFWIDVVFVLYLSIISFSIVVFSNAFESGRVGLIITQSLSLMGYVQYTLRMWGDLDSQMTSVERVAHYDDVVLENDDGNLIPFDSWPDKGSIVFGSVSMRYSPEKPLVLKDINLVIKPGEKIGVVGRTGAGKSSLISVLFRLFDFEGKICIDGIDTKLIPLRILRSKLAIIPQEPVLFMGTLRRNLDPLDEFTDLQLWMCLEDVKLKETVAKLPQGLQSTVSDGGTNFSVGQRQLICLVRAILKNSKVICLDEATANVDQETDKIIQITIRNKFKESTVVTIAHRLNTVMDSDKILVMHFGSVVEFGQPEDLLQNTDGYFYKYVHRNELEGGD